MRPETLVVGPLRRFFRLNRIGTGLFCDFIALLVRFFRLLFAMSLLSGNATIIGLLGLALNSLLTGIVSCSTSLPAMTCVRDWDSGSIAGFSFSAAFFLAPSSAACCSATASASAAASAKEVTWRVIHDVVSCTSETDGRSP